MYVMKEVFRENGLSASTFVSKFLDELKSGLTELSIEFTHIIFDSRKELGNISICQQLNLPLWIQSVVTGYRVKGNSNVTNSRLGKGECNEILYFTVNEMNYFVGFSYTGDTCNQIFGTSTTKAQNPSYCQWMNNVSEFYQTDVKYGWFGVINNYSNIILCKNGSNFYMTFKSSKYGGDTQYQVNLGSVKIQNNTYTNTYDLLRGIVTNMDWNTGIVGTQIALSSSVDTFGKYYGLKGDLINGKFPMFESYVGVVNGGLIGKLIDLVTVPNINQEWGNIVSINGDFYVSTGGYYIRC